MPRIELVHQFVKLIPRAELKSIRRAKPVGTSELLQNRFDSIHLLRVIEGFPLKACVATCSVFGWQDVGVVLHATAHQKDHTAGDETAGEYDELNQKVGMLEPVRLECQNRAEEED